MLRIPTATSLLLALAGSAAAVAGQAIPEAGRTIPRVVAAADSTQSYALFLPGGYSPDRPAPVLALMDPRGRARVPLRLFRPVANDLGYVILSSYTTSSDEPTSGQQTRAGLQAMVNDASSLLSLDTSRLYLVGFSGTARAAWGMAVELGDLVAGVIGFGGGFVRSIDGLLLGLDAASFAYFGGSGSRDFNNLMVRRMDRLLDPTPIPHRVRTFDGRHQWPPAPVAREAVEWMEVQAQRRGLAPVDSAWIEDRYRAELTVAREHEAAGRGYDAYLRYRQAAEGYDGVADASEAAGAAARLADTREVRAAIEEIERWDEWESEARRSRVVGTLEALERPDPPAPGELASIAGLDRLQDQARSGDTLAAQAATRVLASLIAHASFYQPRTLLADGRPEHALRALELASRAGADPVAACRWWPELPAEIRETSDRLVSLCSDAALRLR